MYTEIGGIGLVESGGLSVRCVPAELGLADKVGGWKARLGLGRMEYQVEPGLYAVGQPSEDSPVVVSANYKMSFDKLRKELGGRNAWIVVLDTEGVNVWCAAGKGTFGTDEIVRQIEGCKLAEVVSHRTIVLPQLGAPGVAAHKVKEATGFRVVYGPVYARDIGAFFEAGMRATKEMRRVRFELHERIVLIPVEIVMWARTAVCIAALFAVIAGFYRGGYSFGRVVEIGLPSAGMFLAAYIAGGAFGPILLPWLPGRAFAVKGVWIGLVMDVALLAYFVSVGSWLWGISWALMLPVVTSFMVMNFTGTSTYTSLSGVMREMRIAVPVQLAVAVVGAVLWCAGLFV